MLAEMLPDPPAGGKKRFPKYFEKRNQSNCRRVVAQASKFVWLNILNWTEVVVSLWQPMIELVKGNESGPGILNPTDMNRAIAYKVLETMSDTWVPPSDAPSQYEKATLISTLGRLGESLCECNPYGWF